MTVHPMTYNTRMAVRKALRRRDYLALTAHGTLTDGDAAVSLNGAAPDASGTAAHFIDETTIKAVLNAESYEVTADHEVVITSGDDFTVLEADAPRGLADMDVFKGLEADTPAGPFAIMSKDDEDHPTDPALIEALNLARSDDPTVPVLGGVHVCTDGAGTLWESTDRYMAAEYQDTWKALGLGETIVPGGVFDTFARRKGSMLAVSAQTSTAEIPGLNGSDQPTVVVSARNLDLQYPAIRSLFDDADNWHKRLVVQVSPAQGRRTLRDLGVKKNKPVAVLADGSVAPLDRENPEPVPFGEVIDKGNDASPTGLNPEFLSGLLRVGQHGLGAVDLAVVNDRNRRNRPLQIRYENAPSLRTILMPVGLGSYPEVPAVS